MKRKRKSVKSLTVDQNVRCQSIIPMIGSEKGNYLLD